MKDLVENLERCLINDNQADTLKYLQGATEEQLLDLFVLARYFYGIGKPIIADNFYEFMHKNYKENGILLEYINRTYDEDPTPVELLKSIGRYEEPGSINQDTFDFKLDNNNALDGDNNALVQSTAIVTFGADAGSTEEYQNMFNYLNEDKSLSIHSVTTYAEAYNFFKNYRDLHKDIMTSIKMDGDFTKSLYLGGEYKLSLSRGRHNGDAFDFTKTLRHKLRHTIPGDYNENRVNAECFVEEDYLPILRQKYKGTGYVTAKSAAISMLRVEHAPEDYEHLRLVAFNISGLADTLDGMFDRADELGFETVPHKLIKWEEIPVTFDDFCPWLKANVMDYFYDNFKQYPSDGIVAEVNDMTFIAEQKNQYISTQLALKFEQWSFEIYKGIVEEILYEQKKVYASCRLRIKPMKTSGGSNAEYINGFSFNILLQEKIHVGSEIYFERNSDAVNILVYGERLRQKLGGGVRIGN